MKCVIGLYQVCGSWSRCLQIALVISQDRFSPDICHNSMKILCDPEKVMTSATTVPSRKKFVLELWSTNFENARQELNDGSFDICSVVIAQICDQLGDDLSPRFSASLGFFSRSESLFGIILYVCSN